MKKIHPLNFKKLNGYKIYDQQNCTPVRFKKSVYSYLLLKQNH